MGLPLTGNKERKAHISYPSLHLSEEQLSGLKEFPIDSVVELKIRAKVTGANRERYNDNKLEHRLDITHAEIINKPPARKVTGNPLKDGWLDGKVRRALK